VVLFKVSPLNRAAVDAAIALAEFRADFSLADASVKNVFAREADIAASLEVVRKNVYRIPMAARSIKGYKITTNRNQSTAGMSAIALPVRFLRSDLMGLSFC
jgi:hypothetical protein